MSSLIASLKRHIYIIWFLLLHGKIFFTLIQNREECYNFFEDLCTVNELLSLSQRFEVASMLRDKKTYLEIAEKTGASTATISRVNRSLNYGTDGYELVFNRMKK